MTKRYKLLRDLPWVGAGSTYTTDKDGHITLKHGTLVWAADPTHYPDWFELVERAPNEKDSLAEEEREEARKELVDSGIIKNEFRNCKYANNIETCGVCDWSPCKCEKPKGLTDVKAATKVEKIEKLRFNTEEEFDYKESAEKINELISAVNYLLAKE